MNTAPKKLDVQNINEECEAQAHHAMRFWNNFKVRTKVQSPKYFGVHFWLLVTDGVFFVTSGFWYALSLSLISLELSPEVWNEFEDPAQKHCLCEGEASRTFLSSWCSLVPGLAWFKFQFHCHCHCFTVSPFHCSPFTVHLSEINQAESEQLG